MKRRRIFPAAVCILIAKTAWAADTAFQTSAAIRMIWGLSLVLGILLIIYALLRKRLSFLYGGKGKGAITIVEMRHLMPRKSLCLVRVRGQEFLLGLGQEQISLLAALPPTPETTTQSSPDFATILQATGASDDNTPC